MQDSKNENKQGILSWSAPAQSPAHAHKQFTAPKPPPITIVAPAPSSAKKYAVMIALGIIAGVVIAWGWSAFKAPSKSPASTSTEKNLGVDASAAPSLASGSSLNITSPQVAGNSVAVAAVSVSVPTWIVIYESNAGKPGNALGAALFFPESQSGTVER